MRVTTEQLIASASTYGFSWTKGQKVHRGQGPNKRLVSNRVALLKLLPHNGSESAAREVLEKVAQAVSWTALHALADSALTIRQQIVRDAIADGTLRNEERAIMEYVAARALGVTSSRTVTVTVEVRVVSISGTDYTLPAQASEATRARVEHLTSLGVKAPDAIAAAKAEFAEYLPEDGTGVSEDGKGDTGEAEPTPVAAKGKQR